MQVKTSSILNVFGDYITDAGILTEATDKYI